MKDHTAEAIYDTGRYWLKELEGMEPYKRKIGAIKKVREIHGISLVECKRIVEKILSSEIEVTEFERHYILYAKGWYRRENSIEDLRYIHSVICGMDVQYVHDGYIWEKLMDIVNKYFTTYDRLQWMNELPRASSFLRSTVTETVKPSDMIRMTLAHIGNIQCYGRADGIVIDLGKPDLEKFPKLEKRE